jgi:polyisoprenoid-binding protein YceI
MKLTKIFLLTAICLSLFGFKSVVTKKVDTKNSIIKWIGYKVTGQHEGTITLRNGELNFDDTTNLIGGKFVMDMTTINTTDLEGGSKERLDNHLKNDDFFSVKKYNTADLVFKKVSKQKNDSKIVVYLIDADLTIKGITNPITFKINISNNSAYANLKIDRTKFEIKYGSSSFFDGLKDRAIYDEFDLKVNLKF